MFFSENHEFSVNMNYFDPMLMESEQTAPTEASHLHHEPPELISPPPKRRRGRPRKATSTNRSQASSAASSAAVVKQGTPKPKAAFMRVSPSKKAKKKLVTSPLQIKMVNPSLNGGMLMPSDNKNAKLTSPTEAFSKTSSSSTTTTETKKSQKHQPYNPKPVLPLATQQNTQLLTTSSTSQVSSAPSSATSFTNPSSIATSPSLLPSLSVNPSLLLSSPVLPSRHDFREFKTPTTKRVQETTSSKMNPPMSRALLDSSPISPPVSSNSCFSTIMQSSPLYQGYYANHPSSSTSDMCSSPVKYHVKPINLYDTLKNSAAEVSKNSVKSSISKPQPNNDPHSKSNRNTISTTELNPNLNTTVDNNKITTTDQDDNYKLVISIDKEGYAEIKKVENKPVPPKRTYTNSILAKSKALKNLPLSSKFYPNLSTRSHTVSQVDQILPKSHYQQRQPQSSQPQTCNLQQLQFQPSDFHILTDPLKMYNDPFFATDDDPTGSFYANSQFDPGHLLTDATEAYQPYNSGSSFNYENYENESHLKSLGADLKQDGEEEEDDDDMKYDARNALIKMLRHNAR